MKSVIAIGEALIDFIPEQKGCALKDNASFERCCGGAPANVAAAAAILGAPTKMITQLGQDAFGDFIVEVLENAGVDTSCVLRTNRANTSLAFVALKEDGNREFSFYRNPGADMLLEESQIAPEWFIDCGVLHFCSVDLIEAPVKYAHKRAIALAKEQGALISFDPNIRLPLWEDHRALRKTVQEFIGFADILKISDEELAFITGKTDVLEAAPELFARGVQLILYSEGAKGAQVITQNAHVFAKAVKVDVQDTTGAGDAIIGAFLWGLLEKNIKEFKTLEKDKLQEMLSFANHFAAYSVTGKGAISSYGSKEAILEFIETKK